MLYCTFRILLSSNGPCLGENMYSTSMLHTDKSCPLLNQVIISKWQRDQLQAEVKVNSQTTKFIIIDKTNKHIKLLSLFNY